jgi:osmotically-inducible protein OsmY
VFRDGKACGFIERRDDPTVRAAVACNTHSGLSPDIWSKLRLTDLIPRESWIDADHAGVAVENGVVHLSGQVDSMQGVPALQRIAAAILGATAIIDDLWIPCE